MRRALLALLLSTSAVQAQVSPYDGEWAFQDAASCQVGMDGPGAAISIADGSLYGVESHCLMRNPVSMPGLSATTYDLQCNGEGMTWQEQALLMLDYDGNLVYLSDRVARIMPPCAASTDSAAPSK